MANNPYQDGANNRPRHAKHAARAGSDGPAPRFRRQASEGPAPRRPRAEGPVVAPSSDADDGAVIPDRAPRPIDVDPSENGAFSTLASGQGAVLHDRGNAAEAASAARSNFRRSGRARIHKSARPAVQRREQPKGKLTRPMVIGICAAAVAVVLLIVILALTVLNTPSTSLSGAGQSQRVEQVQDDALDGIEYGGYTYSVREDDDGAGYSFVRAAKSDAQPQVLFQLQGTPVTVVLYNGAFVIPENLDGTWDVVSWVMGDGSVAAELTREDGTPVAGDGTLASAKLDGSDLVLTFGNDVTDTVALD